MAPGSEPLAQRPKPVQLSRELIVKAALDLVDREGIDALTMRGVAEELGTKPMSLYTYVSDKQDLLGGMLDLIASEQVMPSLDQPWRDWVREGAHTVRQNCLAHPNALAAAIRSATPLRFGQQLEGTDAILAALEKAGFDLETAVHVYRAVLNFIQGTVLYQINSSLAPTGLVDVLARADQLPTFTRAVHHYLQPDWDRTFEVGLDMLIAGMERLLEENQRRRTGGGGARGPRRAN
jgi:AcrR family transcriptional regulator